MKESKDLTQAEIEIIKALPEHVKASIRADFEKEDAEREEKQKRAQAVALASAREHVRQSIIGLRALDTDAVSYVQSTLRELIR